MGIAMVSKNLIVKISADQRRRLRRIDAEDFRLVVKKVREEFARQHVQVADGYIERGLFALKQYYAIPVLDPANAHAVTAAIDPFWHTHILFTPQYCSFCDEVAGEYMPHVPLDHDNHEQVENVEQLYRYTRFGVLPKLFNTIDEAFWPAKFARAELVCYHMGDEHMYRELQKNRLFEPNFAGRVWGYPAHL